MIFLAILGVIILLLAGALWARSARRDATQPLAGGSNPTASGSEPSSPPHGTPVERQ